MRKPLIIRDFYTFRHINAVIGVGRIVKNAQTSYGSDIRAQLYKSVAI